MKCPYCGSENTRVVDSRSVDENNSIRRRRICDDCGRRFTTYERVETLPLMVIKKDGNREPYDREKLEGGILRACHKRPVSINTIKTAVDDIEATIYNMEQREITSRQIGEMAMEKVHELDPVAYVRFASVYKEFKDVDTFMDELKIATGEKAAKDSKTRTTPPGKKD
ncbi:MAG TPA: transcriptional regulator NrdR [Lachnospiraceae bacterium]|nr:transcriptional regulator NrdR [Lachnospiraceae bacterium]